VAEPGAGDSRAADLPRVFPGTPGGVGRKGPLLRAATYVLNLLEVGLGRVPGVKKLYARRLAGLAPREVAIPLDRPDPGLAGFRALHLSDIHAGPFLGGEAAGILLKKSGEAAPEAVFLSGDLIAQGDGDLELLDPLLDGLSPPLGVFAVTGNHEFFHGNPDLFAERLSSRRIQVLRNRGVRLEREGGSIWICGVDDPGEGRPDLDAALEGRREGEPAILLCHHPDFFPAAAKAGVTLQVSGHTHGGQVRVLGWTPMSHTRLGYLAGLFSQGESFLYVSRGIGAILLPLRIGAPPELPVLTFPSGRSREGRGGGEA